MTKASVFLIYRDHTDDKVLEIVQGLKDYKGYDSALADTEIEIIPYRNMGTFKEIYDWIVPTLRKMKHFAQRALVWIFPPDMQAAFDKFVLSLGATLYFAGYAAFADIPKGCGFVRGDDALVYVVDRIEHELTHIVWGLTWHNAQGGPADQVKLYPGRDAYPWVDRRKEVTIEGRAYSW